MKNDIGDSFSGDVFIDCSAKHIKEAVEKSLKRLNTTRKMMQVMCI